MLQSSMVHSTAGTYVRMSLFVHSSEPWKKNRPNLYQVLAFIGECVVTFASRKDENFTQYRFF